jgi:hypothetical protein
MGNCYPDWRAGAAGVGVIVNRESRLVNQIDNGVTL